MKKFLWTITIVLSLLMLVFLIGAGMFAVKWYSTTQEKSVPELIETVFPKEKIVIGDSSMYLQSENFLEFDACFCNVDSGRRNTGREKHRDHAGEMDVGNTYLERNGLYSAVPRWKLC